MMPLWMRAVVLGIGLSISQIEYANSALEVGLFYDFIFRKRYNFLTQPGIHMSNKATIGTGVAVTVGLVGCIGSVVLGSRTKWDNLAKMLLTTSSLLTFCGVLKVVFSKQSLSSTSYNELSEVNFKELKIDTTNLVYDKENKDIIFWFEVVDNNKHRVKFQILQSVNGVRPAQILQDPKQSVKVTLRQQNPNFSEEEEYIDSYKCSLEWGQVRALLDPNLVEHLTEAFQSELKDAQEKTAI
ncbi:MAG: hypothetical protein JSR80_08055 [Verrucomicrobia bacterium]|nr:hypothetical protein [Verrucomicrobiota bacterium]